MGGHRNHKHALRKARQGPQALGILLLIGQLITRKQKLPENLPTSQLASHAVLDTFFGGSWLAARREPHAVSMP